ncbi:unnamed protein product [Arabidopsis thaliana]|uniref:(thale cress) hypothetical protein n=1 Tax=Arabidopsis thaliana TaxID=3702 RepID=A0A7G2ERY5_ARATH|nr:unnamed protein product [Arabidopsis thaliana]
MSYFTITDGCNAAIISTKGLMDELCMVICGDWVCSSNGEWKLEICNKLFSRVVPISEEMTLGAFKSAISKEFGTNGVNTSLSYVTPDKDMFTTKEKTPQVLVTSEVGLLYYLSALRENRAVRDISSVGLKTPTIVLTPRDDEFMEELEQAEANIGSNSGQKLSRNDTENEGFNNDVEKLFFVDNDTEKVEAVTEKPEDSIPCGGYDKEFWSNFLTDDYGGSNANELMATGGLDVRYGSNNKVVGSNPDEVVFCTGSGVFDHAIYVNGTGKSIKTEHTKKTAQVMKEKMVGGVGSSQGTRNEVKKLEEVDDEEFDIPHLFEDIEYEVDNLPDLDIDDDGKGIYQGKVYASKEDCQIGLAIYAIKNQFHFKQTRTKWNYFVLSCSDEKCDWRILATLMNGTCYYEIKKAQLQHTCSVETRRQYVKKATSKVIASVFKAKYSEASAGPVPMDLQQLVLEDLRVSASYKKCWRTRESVLTDVGGSDEES